MYTAAWEQKAHNGRKKLQTLNPESFRGKLPKKLHDGELKPESNMIVAGFSDEGLQNTVKFGNCGGSSLLLRR